MTFLRLKPPFVVFLAIVALFSLSITAFAQNETLGALTVGQPVISQIAADSAPSYDLTLDEASLVTFQAISETAQPTITIFQGDEIVASTANEAGDLILSFGTFLTAGDYVVELGASNDDAGSIVLVLQSAIPVSVNDLSLGTPVIDQLMADKPVALYRFTALSEPSLVFIASHVPTSGVEVHLFNETLNRESGVISSELLGGMFHIPANSASYRLEIAYSTVTPTDFLRCVGSQPVWGLAMYPLSPPRLKHLLRQRLSRWPAL